MVRHDKADIMLTNYSPCCQRRDSSGEDILREYTYVFLFGCADLGRLMWKQMSSSKTEMVSSSVITLL